MRLQSRSSLLCLFIFLPIITHAQQPTTPSSAPPSKPQAFNEANLPKTGTVYVLDPANNPSELRQVHATEISSNSHAGGNLLRAQVYMNQHSSVELKGLNASINIDSPQAVFYVRINSDDPELMRNRVHLLRLAQTKDRRTVLTFSRNVFGGQHAKQFDDVAVTKTDAEPGVWLKLTPTAPLSPGEYGVVFMPNDVSMAPDSVYDFDLLIDAAKPEKK